MLCWKCIAQTTLTIDLELFLSSFQKLQLCFDHSILQKMQSKYCGRE